MIRPPESTFLMDLRDYLEENKEYMAARPLNALIEFYNSETEKEFPIRTVGQFLMLRDHKKSSKSSIIKNIKDFNLSGLQNFSGTLEDHGLKISCEAVNATKHPGEYSSLELQEVFHAQKVKFLHDKYINEQKTTFALSAQKPFKGAALSKATPEQLKEILIALRDTFNDNSFDPDTNYIEIKRTANGISIDIF